ncbi:S26 family signal peptidase [Streptomyces macrosporus]
MRSRKPGARSLAGVAMLLGTVLAAAAVFRHRMIVVTVRGTSMAPTYRDGDRVLVRRTTRLVPGQVIVVEQPAPGGRWATVPLPRGARAAAMTARTWLIKRVTSVGTPPNDAVWLLGDNAEDSFDSRHMGWVPRPRVLGVVVRPRRPHRRSALPAERR